MSDEVTVEYVKGLKNDKNVLLIDVREPSELEKTGTIPGSINIPRKLAQLGQGMSWFS
jgi:rhodanese-related sulfurtransferase